MMDGLIYIFFFLLPSGKEVELTRNVGTVLSGLKLNNNSQLGRVPGTVRVPQLWKANVDYR